MRVNPLKHCQDPSERRYFRKPALAVINTRQLAPLVEGVSYRQFHLITMEV
jgi:hypothetical protein